jgi:hypothetical protein
MMQTPEFMRDLRAARDELRQVLGLLAGPIEMELLDTSRVRVIKGDSVFRSKP